MSSALVVPHTGKQNCALFGPKNASRLELSGFDALSVRGGGIESLIRRDLAINPAAASLVAGSVAGAIGVGVAFPLDTLKTKSQVLASNASSNINSDSVSGTATMSNDGEDVAKMNMFQLIALIHRMEGLSGFFGGVKGMMIGQGKLHTIIICDNREYTVRKFHQNHLIK